MEDKYTQLSIAQYSQKLARHLSDTYFTDAETVNGQQLLAFTPVKQINLFMVKELLSQWHREMEQLKSPYFDFENPEVKDALKSFMNLLSRRILIRRTNFEPLLQKAIQDNFTLVLNPAESFQEKFLPASGEFSAATLQEQLKYVDLNKELFAGFLQALPPGNLDKATVTGKLRLYLQAHYKETLPADALIEMLNPLLPLQKQDIQEKPVAPAKPFATAQSDIPAADAPLKPAPVPASGPVGPEAFPKPEPAREMPEPAPVPASGPVGPEAFPKTEPVVEKIAAQAPEQPQPVVPPVAAPSPEMKPVSTATQTQAPDVKLYEKFKAEKPNLNETLRKPETQNLAEKDNRKVESLKESISINQRFSFINELFNGENLEYYEAIQKLDAFPDPASAKNYLQQELASKYNWVKKEEHLGKLLKLIDRKFSVS
jgi:hypothetical protein